MDDEIKSFLIKLLDKVEEMDTRLTGGQAELKEAVSKLADEVKLVREVTSANHLRTAGRIDQLQAQYDSLMVRFPPAAE